MTTTRIEAQLRCEAGMKAFLAAIASKLGAAPDVIEPDRLMRFSTNGRQKDQAGWAILFADCQVGMFGCFRSGTSETWRAEGRPRLTPRQRLAIIATVARARRQRNRDQAAARRLNEGWIRRTLNQTKAVAPNDPVYRYLCARMGTEMLDVPGCLRFHPALPYFHDGEHVADVPAMIAPLVAPCGSVVALHRTYLDPSGRKAQLEGPTKKLSPACGRLLGASIPLATPRQGMLGIAEGIETALAAAALSGLPCVATYCAHGLATWRWPAGVRRVVVFADADQAGRSAAETFRARAQGIGIAVEVRAPAAEGTDWADVTEAGVLRHLG